MRRTTQNLTQQFHLMREITKNVPVGIAILEKEQIQFHNPAFYTILGFSPSELRYKKISAITSFESELTNLQAKIEAILQSGKSLSYEARLKNKAGVPLDLSISLTPLLQRKRRHKVLLTIRDITESRRNERMLTEIHDIYQKSISNALGVPYVLNFSEKSYTFIGENTQNNLGIAASKCTYEEFQQRCVSKFIADPDAPFTDPDEYERAFLSGALPNYHIDIQIKADDGSLRWLSDNAVPIFHPQTQKLYGAMGILQDITDRKQLEKEREEFTLQLRQHKKLESIGFLAAGVAHEINNPLTGMINYAQLIYERIEDETLRTFARGIIEEGQRVATIVRNLLAFARQEKEEHSPAQIADIVKASLSLIKTVLRKNDINLELHVDQNLPSIRCRSQQIQQVIINLLTNAVAALNEKYPTHHPDKIILIKVQPVMHEQKNYVQISIEDHGVGIPAEVIDNIFDPFFTTKRRNEGTGLGLSVSYGIVKEHDGNIFCESESGVYTRFTIEIPASSD